MSIAWKDNVYYQREELAERLRDPIEHVARQLIPCCPEREHLETLLLENFSQIPFCSKLYVLNIHGLQICDTIEHTGINHGHYGQDHSQYPYMKEVVPAWGFLLSDAYINPSTQHPSLTALQILRKENQVLGYLGAEFELRNLPVSPELYQESADWRQIKGDPAIRGQLFQQTRVESPMDRNLPQTFSILEELLTTRGVFQTQIHFSSSQAIVWVTSDPFNYRILDIEALSDPDICMVYPYQAYSENARIPSSIISALLETFAQLRNADENIYLRVSSINIFNGMISLTFSCDGSHYMSFDEFLSKNTAFWFGKVA